MTEFFHKKIPGPFDPGMRFSELMLIGILIEHLLDAEVPGDADAAGGHVAHVGVNDHALLHMLQRLDVPQVLGLHLHQHGHVLVHGGDGIHGEAALDAQHELFELLGGLQIGIVAA